LATEQASLPAARQLYLPEEWAEDEARRTRTGVPGTVAFSTKPQISLAQIQTALEGNMMRGLVLADGGYGN